MTFRFGLRAILAGALIVAAAPAYAQTAPAQSSTAQPLPKAALLDKARSLEGRGRPDLAAQIWQQLLLVDPNQPEALAALARQAKQTGNLQDSKAYLDRLRKVNPADPALQRIQSMPVLTQQQARLREAQRLAGNQQFDQAMQVYREIFGDDPPPGALSIAYYETLAAIPGGWENATAGLRKLTEKYPDFEDYRLSLGRLWTYRPATRLNGMKLLEAIRGNSDLANKARQAWRQALVWEGMNPQVQPSLRAYLARYPDAELQKLVEGPAPAAQAAAPRPTGLARTEIENAGYAALKANNVKEAETQFEKALKENPRSSGALAGIGFVRMKQENFGAAVNAFEGAKAEAPQEEAITEGLETARFYKVMRDASDAFDLTQFDRAIESYRAALAMRPTNVQAMQGLGGALVRAGDPAGAAAVFQKIVEQQPQNDDAWHRLIYARYHATGADSALATARQMPGSVQVMLTKNVEYLVLMAEANSDVGEKPASKKYLQQAVELANAKGLELGVPLQLEFAGLYLRHGYPAEAATLYQRAVDARPEDVDAWEGLLAALIQTREQVRAAHAVEQMPKAAYQAALQHPNFLRSLAAISTSLGRLDGAEKFLERSIELDNANDNKENVAAQLQLAHLRLTQGRPHQAESLLRIMVSAHPDNPDVWKALVSALHQQQMDEDALKEDRREPPAVRAALQDDPDYMSSLAACETAVGQPDDALRRANRALSLLQQQKRAIPADLQIQVAWLLLDTEGDERELYSLLETAGKRQDLTKVQEKGITDIWSVWSIRRANKAIKAGELDRGIAILEAATKLLPKDIAVKRMLAGALLQAGKFDGALAIYKAWGMSGATAQDYLGAVGAAMAANDNTLASVWLQNALAHWPNDPQILTLAGKQAAQLHDYKRAEMYWRKALIATPKSAEQAQSGTPASLAPAPAEEQNPVKAMGDLLVGSHEMPPANNTLASPPLPSVPAEEPLPPIENQPRIPIPPAGAPALRNSGSQPSAQPTTQPLAQPVTQPPTATPPRSGTSVSAVTHQKEGDRKASAFRLVSQTSSDSAQVVPRIGDPPDSPSDASPAPPASSVVPPIGSSAEAEPVVPQPAAGQPSLREEIQDELDSINARNAGFLDLGTTVRGRSGEAGFDSLIVEQAELEASYVIGNSVRVSVIGEPTYLDAGTPDGLSTRRFGLLPVGSTFASQSVGGIGGEAQLSTETFGVQFGMTPNEFLVRNFVGGLRFRPGNGPITLLAQRDTIKDSLLSYAGARDPVTNRVWGGVVANSFSALGNWGGAKTGFYGGVGFQALNGTQVQNNTRLDGNLGVYWRLLDTKVSSLTVGFNLSALHYDHNLSGFTLGQGGYFSPQQYFLTSIPFQWRGTYKSRVQYAANGALGVQHFEEDPSPFFPTMPAVQGENGPYIAKQSETGANYNVDVRAAVQLTPRWYIGAWANINNTRNYTSEMISLYLRYTFSPRSLTPDAAIPSIPDWRGVEPFRLP